MIAVLVFAFLILTQPIITINYGDVVPGEITHTNTQIPYQFTGSAGDVIVVEMRSVNRTMHNSLSEPVLKLQNPRGIDMADTTAVFPVDDTILAAELPIDGDYTIIATRDENVPEPSTGEFTLELKQITQLEDSISAKLNSDEIGHYYFIRTDEDFVLSYHKLGGEFNPEISINRLTPERGGIDPIGIIYGDGVSFGALGGFPIGETYLVIIRQHPFDFYFDVVSAEYELYISIVDD